MSGAGWDYYCWLCGAPFQTRPLKRQYDELGSSVEHETDDLTEDCIDFRICSEGSVAWLNDFVLLGKNWQLGRSHDIAFLTGQATDDGHAVAFAGTHPNTFRHDIDDDGRFAFYAYQDYVVDNEPAGFMPIHNQCLGILQRVLAGSRDGKPEDVLNLDELHNTCWALQGDSSISPSITRLELDYGELNQASLEPYWHPQPGIEPFLLNPGVIQDISLLTDHKLSPTLSSMRAYGPSTNKDLLSRLPVELMTRILLDLPRDSLATTLQCSRAAYIASTDPWFWKRRIEILMPYFWEVRDLIPGEHQSSLDWRAIYKIVLKHSLTLTTTTWRPTLTEEGRPLSREEVLEFTSCNVKRLLRRAAKPPEIHHALLPIANRRRIWDIAVDFKAYHERSKPWPADTIGAKTGIP